MISVLCANRDSVYKTFPDLDVWDAKRNAYNFTGQNMVIAHPPCAQWSRLKKFAKENEGEKGLAWFCLEMVEKTVDQLHSSRRSDTTKEFAEWLIKSVSK